MRLAGTASAGHLVANQVLRKGHRKGKSAGPLVAEKKQGMPQPPLFGHGAKL
jgi:hypothetical protein